MNTQRIPQEADSRRHLGDWPHVRRPMDPPFLGREPVVLHCILNRFTWSVTDESQANVLIRNDSSAGAVASGTNMKGPSQSQHECNERPAKCKPRPTGQDVVQTGQEDSVHALSGAAGATAAAAGERLRGQAENLLGNEEIGAVLELAF